mgnify:FL=1
MANGTLTEEEEERLLMERAAARAANPAVNTFADLSASYIPEQYAKPLDVFKEMVSPYNMDYTSPSGTLSFDPSGTTYPQYDDAGNVKVYQGQVFNPPVHGVYHPVNEQFMALDAPTANFFANATPDDIATGQVPTGSRVRTGVLPPAEVIKGSYNTFEPSWLGLDSDLGTVPGIKEIQITPTEIEKVISGQGATAKTIHQRPNEMPEAQKYIDKLNTPLPGTGVETSMLGKAGPYLKGAGRFLGLAGYPMSAMAATDYWGAGKPVRAAMAAGSALPVVGPGFLAAEMLTNAVTDGIQPEDAADASMGGGGMPGPTRGGHPGMGMAAGYDVSGQTPSLAGTQTGMDVAVDAGGAVGGYPTMDADYGTMATEESDYVPEDPTGGLIDIDALAGRFDVGPTSMAQVGTNSFGIPDKSYGKVSKTNSELLADTAATKEMNTSVDNMINKLGNTGALSGTAQDYGYSHPFQTAWYDHPYMSSEDAMFSQGMKQKMDQQDSILGGLAYSALQPVDEGTKLATSLAEKLGFDLGAIPVIGDYINRVDDDGNVLQPASLAGTLAQMAFPMTGVQQDNIPALVDDIVERNVLNPYGFENPLATSALANPDITAQNQIDAYNAASMGQIASHPGQGGYIGDTERTIGEHLAAVNERVQAMPAVTTSQALSTQDERQQAMPSASEQAAARAEITRQTAINAQMTQEAAGRQRQQQAAIDAQIAASVMAPRQDAMPAAPAGPSPAQIAAQVAAAEQAHRDQQASARQALKDFYNSRAYQQEGASTPAGLIDIATEVDSFATIAEQGGGYQGGYADMGGFEGYR